MSRPRLAKGVDFVPCRWGDRELANLTGTDIAEFLPIAGEIPIRAEVTEYRLDQANEALISRKREPVRGAKVLRVKEN